MADGIETGEHHQAVINDRPRTSVAMATGQLKSQEGA